MKQLKFAAAAMILLGCAVTAGITLAAALRSDDGGKERNSLLTQYIGAAVQQELSQPIAAAQLMAADTFLHSTLRQESAVSAEASESAMAEYLGAITARTGVSVAFVVSEQSRRYYTASGIAKLVNPQEQPYDIWYQLFLDSGKDYELDTDRDQLNGYRWMLFVNRRITDADGTFLGVCGTGIFMDRMQELIAPFERRNGIKVNITDADGLVQIDSDSSNIETTYLFEVIEGTPANGMLRYEERGANAFCATQFLAAPEWYLVVQGKRRRGAQLLTLPLLVALGAVCAGLLLLLFLSARIIEQKAAFIAEESPAEDRLTGLPNRNYFKEAYGELGVFNTTRYKALAVFDIDKFKILNDTRWGDKIILDIVAIVKDFVAERGMIFRWGGDEFVALLEIPADEAVTLFNTICTEVKRRVIATVSVGVVPINLADTIKTNYYRAVQLCYAVKESGGNGAKRP